MTIRVVHCKRDSFDVYIGRPSIWGNPYLIGRDGSRRQVIERYRSYLAANQPLLDRLSELEDKVLGCWCAPLPCHGDVLKEFAERGAACRA